MANNYTQFSFCINDLTPAEEHWVAAKYEKESKLDEGCAFLLEVDRRTAYLCSDECGDLDCVVAFVRAFLKTHRPHSSIGFEWAETCSKPRPNEFGGGAVLVTATTDEWMSTGKALDILRRHALRRQATGDVRYAKEGRAPEALVCEGWGTDYVLTDTSPGSSVWIRVRDIAAHLVVTDEGIVVDLFTERNDEEGVEQLSDEAVGSTYAFFDEGCGKTDRKVAPDE